MRVAACDDGEVRKLGAGYTIAACISWDSSAGVDGIAFSPIHVDGLDATGIVSFLAASLGRVEAVLLDSLTIGGFNVVSPATLHEATGAPVAVVYTYEPSLERLRRGLSSAGLPCSSVRERILRLVEARRRIQTPRGPLYIVTWPPGTPLEGLVSRLVIYDRKPAPLRAAHYIASALSRLLIHED